VDPRFSTIRARGEPANMKAIDDIIGQWTKTFKSHEIAPLLVEAAIPSAPVYTIADIYGDEHFNAREMLVQVAHPVLGHTTQTGVVPKLSRTPGSIRHTGPGLGENSSDILASMGLSRQQIDELIAKGVVR